MEKREQERLNTRAEVGLNAGNDHTGYKANCLSSSNSATDFFHGR